ncbi:MAG: helix-turn-helix domain-containing protein [Bacilli bacterium]|nr:helix-turn-helix domain-containing protein [Bacilli bacterium]
MASILFNITELADYLHISVSLIRKLVKNKEIPHNRLGVKLLFSKAEIDIWLKDHQINGDY